MDTTIRPSRKEDIPAISAIYAHHVLHGLGSFEIVPPSEAEMAERRAQLVAQDMPYLVAERAGTIIGFAYAALYRARAAYRYTVEDSIYIDPKYTGQGVGRKLLSQLIIECEKKGFRQMIAVVGDSRNLASIRLHESLGFKTMGCLRSVGWKFSGWVDIVDLQLPLGEGDRTLPS